MSRIILILVLLIVFFAGAGYYFLNNQNSSLPIALPSGGVCDKDSFVCEDGTVLKREGPQCSFPPCPSTDSAAFRGNKVTVAGTTICLPHKNNSGPQTLECALGIEADDGNNYALTDPGWKFLIGTGNGVRVEIKGNLTKTQDSRYNSAGNIEIEDLVKLN